ncbi:helix-turn-helix domain-containing protein [Archangium violaceum]|uniref:winged helix-turn-helix transcriptional regulator n=1 Tax=Archangium violaceum TaxID=83451 RepID=UPI002B2D983B|nr:helix-turn-helix domain-containing protein [Archangium gephyra]
MQRTSFSEMQCPIARSLERVGEWWSILILRDAFYGLTRFDELQKILHIAPNMLTRRLTALVEEGLLERRQYCGVQRVDAETGKPVELMRVDANTGTPIAGNAQVTVPGPAADATTRERIRAAAERRQA